MRRLFWVALGATVGALVVRRMGKVAQAYSPAGVATGLGGALEGFSDSLRELAGAVREAMGEREAELRYALGIDTGTGQAEGSEIGGTGAGLTTEEARALLDHPTGLRPEASGR